MTSLGGSGGGGGSLKTMGEASERRAEPGEAFTISTFPPSSVPLHTAVAATPPLRGESPLMLLLPLPALPPLLVRERGSGLGAAWGLLSATRGLLFAVVGAVVLGAAWGLLLSADAALGAIGGLLSVGSSSLAIGREEGGFLCAAVDAGCCDGGGGGGGKSSLALKMRLVSMPPPSTSSSPSSTSFRIRSSKMGGATLSGSAFFCFSSSAAVLLVGGAAEGAEGGGRWGALREGRFLGILPPPGL